MTTKKSRTAKRPQGPVDAKLREQPLTQVVPEDRNDPKKLFAYVREANKQELAAREVRKQALRLLRESIDSATFTADGKVYQIRERGGEPYLVEMPAPGNVVNL